MTKHAINSKHLQAVEAEQKFRRAKGWRDIEKLIRALEAREQKQEAIAELVA